MSDAYLLKVEKINEEMNRALPNVFPEDVRDDITVQAAMYSLMAGGKRFRPCLMFFTADMLGIDREAVKLYACVLEMIHTYSLIHDDLPGMDNDDLRRGKPTCHKVYGEGIAVLAGDMLLNRAFELMSEDLIKAIKSKDDPIKAAAAASVMSRLAGVYGMLGGQSIDKASEEKRISLDELYLLQEKKTGALIEAAVTMPYYLINGLEETELLDQLKKLSMHIGLAFQIKDDLLDVTSSPDVLGKSVGKDDRDNKSTFVTLLGQENAEKKLNDEIKACYDVLEDLDKKGYHTESYYDMIAFLAERDY